MIFKALQRMLAKILVAAILTGCSSDKMEIMNYELARPELDLTLLDFDRTGKSVDLHSEKEIHLRNDSWIVSIRPISKKSLIKLSNVLNGIISQGGTTYRADSISNKRYNLTIYRYLRGIEEQHYVVQANYLICINDYWFEASAIASDDKYLFDQDKMDLFLLSLKILDAPNPANFVLPAWKEYQKNRISGPDAKFILYSDPAPVCIGDYATYCDLMRTKSVSSPIISRD